MSEIFYRVPKNELDEVYSFHFRHNEDKRTRYTWEWEYGTGNPRNSLLLAVKDDNRIIATQGMISINVSFGGQVNVTGKNESLLIDIAYRGKKLSTRFYKYAMDEYAQEGLSCIWGFSSKAIIPLQKAGFRVFENIMTRMVFSLSYKQAAGLIPERVNRGLLKLILKPAVLAATAYSKVFKFFLSRRSKNYNGVEFLNDLKSEKDLTDFYKEVLEYYPGLIFIDQDHDYFNWRIRKAPYPVITIFLYKDTSLKGYLYLTVTDRYCEITDFTFLEKKAGRLLMRELMTIIRREKYGFLYYTGNSENRLNRKVLSLLSSYGFLKMKGPSHFVLKNYNYPEGERLFRISDWYMNELWSEGN